MNSDQYIRMLLSLFPKGKAWSQSLASVFYKLCDSMSQELVRLDTRARVNMINEALPDTTFEMIADWERVVGLPDSCTDLLADTLPLRRVDVVRKLRDRGGQSAAFFIALAADFGYTVTIQDKLPARCGIMRCGDRCYGEDWTFHWIVDSPAVITQVFQCGVSRCGDRLRVFRNATLECVINQKKPSHTKVHFTYGG